MAIVQPKSVKYRVWATHLVMWGFLALIIFPLIMVIAISFRNGNFAVGEIIPSNPTLDHWKLALGMSITNADGSITPPPFPVLTWLWNSIKIAGITALMIVVLSTTCAYAFAPAFSWQVHHPAGHADFPDVPGGAGTGGHLCAL